ncbi:MAG: DUF6504 family protein [Ardenticatenaceae bacterium]|nr:DUF6504 family protein [Ardenticatenaceae bacterium]
MSVLFITEPIQVEFDTPPRFRRRPHCPDRLLWRGETHHVKAVTAEWRKFTPRISKSLRRIGLARIYFRVILASGRELDIYFDPVHQKGSWFVSVEHL